MSDSYWAGRKVAVTGSAGFIGSHVTELLVQQGAEVTVAVHPSTDNGLENLFVVLPHVTVIESDLTRWEDCVRVCSGQEVVFNVAHVDGSVAFKQSRPAFIFRQNMLITLQMLEAAHRCNADRFMLMSSAEVYAEDVKIPTPESLGFKGLPSQVTDGYAWSKRMSEFGAEVFAREYGLQVAIARPSNVYGPRDYVQGQKGRVIPSFVSQALYGDQPIRIWGDGNQFRSFLYVTDLARGLLDLVEKYPKCDPVNFGSTYEITIKELAEVIVKLSGRDVPVICDPSRPSGPGRRISDVSKAKQVLGFNELVPLEIGLQNTIAAIRQHHLEGILHD